MTLQNQRELRILDVIRSLREGEVVSYGDIAHDAGFPQQSRLVGRILATSPEELPWWRVVNSVGRLVPENEREQSELLALEGVRCFNGYVKSSPIGRFRRTMGSTPAVSAYCQD